MREARQRDRGHFWWRAAEPIPARPDAAALSEPATYEQDHAPPLAPDRPAPSSPVVHAAPAADSGGRLGWQAPFGPPTSIYGPERGDAPFAVASGPELVAADLDASPRLDHATLVPGRRRPTYASPRRAVIIAGLAGALLFAAVSGLGRNVRNADPIGTQLDALIARAGFAVNEVSVSGLARTLESEVFAALGPTNRSILTIDVAAARHRIEQLPTVETAVVARDLPDKLRIVIRERQPVAVWDDGTMKRLVDPTGVVLGPVGREAAAGMPQIAGAGAPEALPGLLRAFADDRGIGARMARAVRRGERRWDLELADGRLVKLPSEGLRAAIARLRALDKHAAGLAGKGTVIDLRLPDRIAIGPRSLETGATTTTAADALAMARAVMGRSDAKIP